MYRLGLAMVQADETQVAYKPGSGHYASNSSGEQGPTWPCMEVPGKVADHRGERTETSVSLTLW